MSDDEALRRGAEDAFLLAHRALLRDVMVARGLVETAWVRILNEAADTRRSGADQARAAALAAALLQKLVEQGVSDSEPPMTG